MTRHSEIPRPYLSALKRLKQGCTWQGIANHLTEALDDGRVVFRSEVWKMVTQGKWSPKVAQGLRAAGEIPGAKKRFRLHAEFQSQEEMYYFMDHFSIDNKDYTFTEWSKEQLLFSLSMKSDWEHYLNLDR